MDSQRIEQTLQEALPGCRVEVRDPMGDGQHLEAFVVHESFSTMNLVEQHRVVMLALKNDFETDLHALALRTCSPSKWQDMQETRSQQGERL